MLIFLILIATIIIHEFGHFIIAKSLKYEVTEFSVGFGPKLFSKKFKGTDYSIRAIPLGGYVNISEEELSRNTGWKNALVLVSGAIFNFIGAAVGFIILYLVTDFDMGLFIVLRGAFLSTIDMIYQVILAFIELFSGGFKLIMESTVSPVGFIAEGSEMVKTGQDAASQLVIVIKLFILLNINLGVFNLIPIPILDGFKFLLEILRGITKKDFKKFELLASSAGLVFLGALFIATIGKDLLNFL